MPSCHLSIKIYDGEYDRTAQTPFAAADQKPGRFAASQLFFAAADVFLRRGAGHGAGGDYRLPDLYLPAVHGPACDGSAAARLSPAHGHPRNRPDRRHRVLHPRGLAGRERDRQDRGVAVGLPVRAHAGDPHHLRRAETDFPDADDQPVDGVPRGCFI